MLQQLISGRSVRLLFGKTLLNEVNAVLSRVLKYFLLELSFFAQDSIIEPNARFACETESSVTGKQFICEYTNCEYIGLLGN